MTSHSHDLLGAGHRRDVVDVLGQHGGDLRVVHEVHVGHRVERVRRVLGHAHVVGPDHRALGRHDELERRTGRVGLEHVARPGHGGPDVALGQRRDVVLLVVLADQPGIALLLQPVRGGVPVRLLRRLGVHTDGEQRRVRQVLVVAEHADLALERSVLQIRPTGDLLADTLGVVADASDAGLPRHRVDVAVVIARALHQAAGVGVEVRHLRLVEGRQIAQLHQLVEVRAVGDDDDVVADALAGGELRLDLAEERRVLLDDLLVGDLDAGLLGEQVERRMVVLVLVARVEVERPVGEVEPAGLLLRRPERLHRVLRG